MKFKKKSYMYFILFKFAFREKPFVGGIVFLKHKSLVYVFSHCDFQYGYENDRFFVFIFCYLCFEQKQKSVL